MSLPPVTAGVKRQKGISIMLFEKANLKRPVSLDLVGMVCIVSFPRSAW